MGNKLRAGCACLRPRNLPTPLSKKYILDEDAVLGQGTFAVVYRGKDRSTQQDVAVKIIDKANSRRDLLNTEIWILQNFGHHSNIVNLYDIYETEGEVQLVIELMLGGELFDLLDENGPYGEGDAAKYLKAIAGGLAYLHAGNVAHRDLKPENLLLTSKGPHGVLKISDFGLAKILIDEDIMRVACGTWIYCAPEVLNLKRNKTGEYDLKCDVFSVGCILYIMMGGYHPFDFDGNDDEELMQECILEDTWDFEDPAWDEVSHQAKDLIELMLMWDPADRLTAQELLDQPWTQGDGLYGRLSRTIDQDLKNARESSKNSKLEAASAIERQNSLDDSSRRSSAASLMRPPASPYSIVLTPAPGGTSEGTGGTPEAKVMTLATECEVDGGTGGVTVGRQRSMSAMSANTMNRTSKAHLKRASLHSLGVSFKEKHMPKKHMPHAGSHEEATLKVAGLSSFKDVGAHFNPQANEARWEKFYMQGLDDQHRAWVKPDYEENEAKEALLEASVLSVQEVSKAQQQESDTAAIEPPPNEPQSTGTAATAGPAAAKPVTAAAAAADATASKGKAAHSAAAGSASPAGPTTSAKAKAGSSTAFAEAGSTAVSAAASTSVVNADASKTGTSKSFSSAKSKAKSGKSAAGSEKKFETVEEWKAKQAPKLVKEAPNDGEASFAVANSAKKGGPAVKKGDASIDKVETSGRKGSLKSGKKGKAKAKPGWKKTEKNTNASSATVKQDPPEETGAEEG